jgi:hypothetical protein
MGDDCMAGASACGEGVYWNPAIQRCMPVEACPGDVNSDGQVQLADLLSFLTTYGSACSAGGCTDVDAMNFSVVAQFNDGSCVYADCLGLAEGQNCDGSCQSDADGDGICDGADDCWSTSTNCFEAFIANMPEVISTTGYDEAVALLPSLLEIPQEGGCCPSDVSTHLVGCWQTALALDCSSFGGDCTDAALVSITGLESYGFPSEVDFLIPEEASPMCPENVMVIQGTALDIQTTTITATLVASTNDNMTLALQMEFLEHEEEGFDRIVPLFSHFRLMFYGNELMKGTITHTLTENKFTSFLNHDGTQFIPKMKWRREGSGSNMEGLLTMHSPQNFVYPCVTFFCFDSSFTRKQAIWNPSDSSPQIGATEVNVPSPWN